MGFLLLQNLRHIVRTRLLVAMFFFSFLIQFLGVKALHSATIYFQGVVTTIGVKEALLIALLFQLFTGAFLAAVYGIWMIPYAHQGLRSLLTFTLPVSKWKFPAAYVVSMGALLVLQHLILLLSFGMNFGFGVFGRGEFPWNGLMVCLCVETVAFEMITFAFACSSMLVGAIPTLFLGAGLFVILQGLAILFRFNVGQFLGGQSEGFNLMHRIYEKLPPTGELVFDLRTTFARPSWLGCHLVLWVAWLAVFILLFRYKIRYPSSLRGGEL